MNRGKIVVDKGFIKFLRTKKYSAVDFIEPVLALPLAYGILKFFQGVNEITLITAVIIFLVYAPLIFAVFKWRRK